MSAKRLRLGPVAGLMACLMLLSVAGCAQKTPVTADCQTFQPITVGEGDKLSDETARQILAHNETYRAVCGNDGG